MIKQCSCGQWMNVRLRTLLYTSKVAIENVPILCCEACSRSEVFPEIKPELTGLIGELGDNPEKQQLHFHEINELAHLMYQVSDKERLSLSVEEIVEERINELLDLMILAHSLEDIQWVRDINNRLSQISKHRIASLHE